ncbi:PREDICTED: uncharacterized protein LOC104802786 [Tarenaya hassleriana]|uniref:uncharacterized protein LOC104802786 n=1 Tax=Tarenaya hassleriana TaxID=28532 RepID=UPI00053C5311|nr:PREDICTED: uncharacterized protein LOC104802786 [Tarenaya hassleriana]
MTPTMAKLVSETNPRPNITCEATGFPRKVLGTYEIRVSVDERKIGFKIPKISVKKTSRTQKQDNEEGETMNMEMAREGKEKENLFLVKVSSVISGVSRKMTTTSAKANQKMDSLREIKRVSSSIMTIARRLKARAIEKVREHAIGEEEELCKKRILMGEKCRPLNRSGTLLYDGDGILLPEP